MNPHIKHVTSPAPRDIWQRLFEQDCEAIPYQSLAWFDSACKVGNYADASRLYTFSDGRQAVLPLVRTRGVPAPLAMVGSMPEGWGMGGLISAAPVTVEDLTAIFDDLMRLPYLRVTIRPNPRHGELWKAAAPQSVIRKSRFAHVLDLEGGFDKVFDTRFSKKTRRAVRDAQKNDVRVEFDTTGKLVTVFYDLWLDSIKRWAAMQNEPLRLARWRNTHRDPLEKFHNLADSMGKAFKVGVAWVESQPAAASVVLQYGNVNDSRGAMNKELTADTSANDLLQSEAIRIACEGGCRYYHMGESAKGSGVEFFKQRFGAVGYDYEEYFIERYPITKADKKLRTFVKKLIRFKD